MGVTGLLGLLKSIQKPCSLKAFSGQTIGVDAYGWLHRAAVSCAIELAQDKPTTKIVDFAMHRVRMLLHYGVTPYLVFDGDHLPSKADVEKSRAERRRSSRAAGLELLRLGKTAQAYQELQKAIDITPEHARQLIEELKHNDVKYVVAPYEADSQLVYLERKGLIHGILSEDSDLLVFGAKCLLTKLDQYGECIMIRQHDFTACRDINLVGWSISDFRRMAILSGCDYLDGIHMMGLRTAHRMVRKYKTIDRVIRGAQLEGKFNIPTGYMERFIQAEWTFLYQFVYCPEAQQLVHLTPPESDTQLAGLDYFGKSVEPHIARLVASGDLHPGSKQPILVESLYTHKNRPPPARKPSSVAIGMKGRPIDQFFKPKRVPLAELDPNIFTPSPSQQQLLQQNANRSWVASSSTSLNQATLESTQDVENETPAPRTILPALNAVKRPRLCSDANEGTLGSATKVPLGETSKFFTSRVFNSTPSLKRGPAGKRRKASAINVWSDESIEDAMASLPDLTSSATTSRSSNSSFEAVSPVDGVKFNSPLVFAAEVKSTALSSEILQGDEPKAGLFSVDLLERTREFRAKFALQQDNEPALQRDNQTASADAVDHQTTPTPPPSQGARTAATYSAAQPSQSPEEVSILETPVRPSQMKIVTPQDFEPLAAEPELPDQNNDLPPLLTHATETPPQRWAGKGSEDLLSFIPDSDAASEEGEDLLESASFFGAAKSVPEEEDEVDEVPVSKLKFDMRRFAFPGAA